MFCLLGILKPSQAFSRDVPAPRFSFSGEPLQTAFSLQPAQPGRVLAASGRFPWGWWVLTLRASCRIGLAVLRMLSQCAVLLLSRSVVSDSLRPRVL